MSHDRAALLDRLANGGPFGFGGSSLGNLYREIDEERAHATVYAAWGHGVRYFDTAPFYGFGLGERRLGDVLRTRNRDDLVLSTKVGRLLMPGKAAPEKFGFRSPMPFDPVFDYSYDGVMRSVEASLHRLGMARIDILYMHDLGRLTHGDDHERHFRHALDGGFRAMTDLRDQGVVAGIGLGVNEVEICVEALPHADFDLFMVAGRYTLLDQSAARFFDDCRRRGIGVVAAGVFNSGVLAAGSASGAPRYDYEVASDAVIERVAVIEQLCKRFDVPLPAAALQFARAHPAVVSAVVGTGRPARVSETVDLARRSIPIGFWAALETEGLIAAEGVVPA